MKTNEMKKRIWALYGISVLCIISIIIFGLSILKDTNVSVDEKAVEAYNYLEANTDLSSAQIIGIISNIKLQSNFDTTLHQSSGISSFGLMNWNYYFLADELEEFAVQNGKDVEDFYLQLDFLIRDISEDSASFKLFNHKNYTIEDWNSVNSPAEAAVIFEAIYIRGPFSTPNLKDIANTYAKSLTPSNSPFFLGAIFQV